MLLDKYDISVDEGSLYFEFNSEGPNGKITKVVQYSRIASGVFNLAFGDLDPATGKLSDTNISNNNDTRKVLATVAGTVYRFLDKHPHAMIIATGHTKARTRLYRISLSRNFDLVSRDFDIYGFRNGDWEPFEMNKECEVFLVVRKMA